MQFWLSPLHDIIAIKDMASNLERKWRQLLVASQEDSKRMDVDSDGVLRLHVVKVPTFDDAL